MQRARSREQQGAGFSAFLSFLEHGKVLTPEAAGRARKAFESTDHPADTILIELGLTREGDLARHLSTFLEIPALDGEAVRLDEELVERLGLDFLQANHVLPLDRTDQAIVVGVADPFDSAPVALIGFHLECEPQLRILPRSIIVERIRSLGERGAGEGQPRFEATAADTDDIERLQDYAREAPVIRFVSQIIQQAMDRGATDIHVEPTAENVRIRFRCDGLLSVVETAPKAMHAGIATRIKILSRLNIAERRLPQDGRMRVSIRGQEIDLRVSVLPSVHGETFVLRILDKSGVALRLDALGYEPDAIGQLQDLAKLPNGIVLVTGPTGSGKTTTLYSILKERDTREVKIFTVEDPIEYRLDGITQLQVDPAIDLTFARALRSVLRQDPDIILVGEIRDRETAQIAVQASLTGHLVLSTLHTNSAAGALTRLLDMGVEGYLIGATIRAVVAQRLLRRTCSACERSGRAGATADACPGCRGTGYRGRTVTYEIIEVTPALRALISEGATEDAIMRHLKQNGITSLSDHAARLVANGVTTREEAKRVLDYDGT